MTFFDKYNSLCQNQGKSANAVAAELDISSGTVTVWKQRGTKPRPETLKRIANYFHVSVDYLISDTDEKKPLVNGDEELTELLERARDDPNIRMLFSVTKNAKPEDIERAIKIIQALKEGS